MPIVRKQLSKPGIRKIGSVLTRLASAWDLTETLSMLLYGRSGTGKTTIWATFPKPILAIVISGGKKPGELRSINTPELRKAIEPRVVKDSSDIRDLLEIANDYGTAVIDHVTGLQDLVLAEILGLKQLPEQKSWGMASREQYGQCSLQCKELLKAFLSLDCNRVLVAQEREFNNEGDQDLIMPFVGAALTPSLVGWLNPACDYIGQTFIRSGISVKESKLPGGKIVKTRSKTGRVEYCLRTAPHEVYTTKFRVAQGSSILPEVIVDPSYSKIMKVIQGG